MMPITQDESFYIKKHSPTTHIMITSKNKRGKAKNYFAESTKIVLKLLDEYKNKLKVVK
jgi:hypothetical protein